MNAQRRLYSVPEAAEALGIGRSTLYEILRDEGIRSVRIGRSRLIPAEALDEFIAMLTEGDDTGEANDG